MRKHNFEFVEPLIPTTCLGALVPYAVAFGDAIPLPAGPTAAFVATMHASCILMAAMIPAMDKRPLTVFSTTASVAGISALAGMALFRCLCEGLNAGVDFMSIASGTIIGGTIALSLLAYAAAVDFLKRHG